MKKAVNTKAKTAIEPMAHDKDHMVAVADTIRLSSSLSDCFPEARRTDDERINDRELHSIYALLAYVAYNQNVRQETVQMIVEAHFRVDHVSKIQRNDYMKAVEYLVDLKMDEILQ